MKIKTISPSKLAAYDNCPSCFFLSTQKAKFVQTPAIIWGLRMHKALEAYHKGGEIETDKDLQPYLNEYMAKYNQDFDVCEEFWRLPLLGTGITLVLKIDLVKDNVLTDHKTAKRLPTQEEIDEQKQLSAYSWAINEKFGIREDHIQFNYFLTEPEIGQPLFHELKTQRSLEDLSDWEDWTLEILDGIENDRFDPKPARFHNFADCPLYFERS